MIALDTNVLIRYLTNDEPAQAEKARACIERAIREGTPVFIGVVVLCELAWVLRSSYKFPKQEIVSVLAAILSCRDFAIESRGRIRAALDAYRNGRGDFSDYLIGFVARDAGAAETVTFDRRLAGDPGFRLLT